MTSDTSDRISDLFTNNSHNLTPVSARHAVTMLYLPIMHNPQVTQLCASLLSDAELHRAERFTTQDDQALFQQRRAFRRFCGAQASGSVQPLSKITFSETENGRPHLADLPDLWFSFSACRFGLLGAWSSTHGIGVDIEDQTRPLEATALAWQFFSSAEADAVAEADRLQRQRTLFQLWTLKEAALKSIGEGLPFGLDAFGFELAPDLRIVHTPPGHGGTGAFSAHLIEEVNHCAALVVRRLS